MWIDQIAQELLNQNERIEELEHQADELSEQVSRIRTEILRRKCCVQELLFQAVSNLEGEISSYSDLLM